jgi:Tol biopolymer transport system component
MLVCALCFVPAAVAQSPQDTTRKAENPNLPLIPGRTVAFTTSEGSWINVDVSPDGTIVFDLLGDLYTLPIAGGRATRLTSGTAFDGQPRFSPDGSRITFVSDRSGGDNIWVMSLDGRDTTQVTKGNNDIYTSPEWTPDGSYIIASKAQGPLGGAAKLWLYHVRGGSGVQLAGEPAAPPTAKMLGAAFGPDPRYLWYAQRNGDWQYNAILPQFQLGVYDRHTGQYTTMSSRYGSAFRPALSPDGRWLVYGSRHDLHTGLRVRDLESGEERWLAYPVQRDDQESRANVDVFPGYSFTPDGNNLVISFGGEIWSVALNGSGQRKIPFTADVSLSIGPMLDFQFDIEDDATFVVRQIRDAVPSPDGRRLAFTALDRVYVMDYPAGTPRRLTDADVGEFDPVWSPDGAAIAWVTWSDTTGGDIWRTAADGRDTPLRLTSVSANYRQIAWSPDAARIVALRATARDMQENGGGPSQLVWVPATGGDVTVIAPSAGRSQPHFTSDLERIYASAFSRGLVSFRWDGTDERAHVRVTGPPQPGSQGPPPSASAIFMAPTGDQALAVIGNDLYVVTVPIVGGATPTISVASPENAAFPARRLTDIGGQFPAWSRDGRSVHWSIGNAHVVYDLDRARAFDDSVAAERRAAAAPADTGDARPRPDSAAAKYTPDERRIEIRAQRDLPQGTAVLRGARALTMRDHEIIENADIVIRNNRIAAIGPRGQVEVPADARVIDVAGKWVIPGFVDTHYHAQWLVNEIHNSSVWQYPANLAYGVTTTRDPQTSSTDILTYADRVETGDMVGPRIYSTGPGVFAGEQIASLDQARNILKRYAEYYDTKTLKMYMTGNRQQRQWVIMAANELRLKPTTEGGLDFKLNLTHALDGYPGMEHTFPIYPVYQDVVKLFAESQILYSPTLIVSYGGPMGENFWYATTNVHDDTKLRRFTPHSDIDAKSRRRGGAGPAGWALEEEYVFEDHARFVADLIAAGGKAGVGGHGQIQGIGYHWELWMMQSNGLPAHDALRAATIFGAEGIGFEKDIGTLEAGKLADLIVLERDPLQDLRNSTAIQYVMKNGRLYQGETLKEVYPRTRDLPRKGWWEPEPANVNAGIRGN